MKDLHKKVIEKDLIQTLSNFVNDIAEFSNYKSDLDKIIQASKVKPSNHKWEEIHANEHINVFHSENPPPIGTVKSKVSVMATDSDELIDTVWKHNEMIEMSPTIYKVEAMGSFTTNVIYEKISKDDRHKNLSVEVVRHFHKMAAMGVSHRDFIVWRIRFVLNNNICLKICKSLDNKLVVDIFGEKYAPDCEGFVRGFLHGSLFLFEKSKKEHHTNILYCLSTEPKGWIPTFLIKSRFKAAGDDLWRLKQFIEKKKHKKTKI